jgi:hypothetical protein
VYNINIYAETILQINLRELNGNLNASQGGLSESGQLDQMVLEIVSWEG